MAIIFIGLGGNEGNRMQILQDAALGLKKNLGMLLKHSAVYETPAWGFESDQPFLNAVMKFESTHKPEEILNILHYFEDKAGRKRTEGIRYSNRTLDLDLLYYDALLSDEETLQLPHPRIAQRNFVLQPLVEIDPEWFDIRNQKTVSEMLGSIRDAGAIERFADFVI